MEVGLPNLGCDNVVALAKQTLISLKASSFQVNSLAFNSVGNGCIMYAQLGVDCGLGNSVMSCTLVSMGRMPLGSM